MKRRSTRAIPFVLGVLLAAPGAVQAQPSPPRARAEWVALADGGFVVPAGTSATDLLVEMQPLLASPDPVLRDVVAFSAAERWIVRDRVVSPDGMRRLMAQWLDNLSRGLGTSGDDRVYLRTFSALSLSLVAARETATPFLTAGEAQTLFDRLLDYVQRERDRRGYDAVHGWAHAVAHSADAFRFLARGRHWAPGNLPRLLDATTAVIASSDTVFVWGENDRVARALHAAVRRADAEPAALEAWCAHWVEAHRALWAGGPLVQAPSFAAVENAAQVLRSLAVALATDAAPTAPGEAARTVVLAALTRMR